MNSPDQPPQLEPQESETLSETADKLERLRELARKYSASEGSKKENTEVEEALESHEVVELQAFVRHKEWIEQKIQFLESLPPIDIFAGIDELPKTYDQITSLATRAQLEEWVAEHDRIDKETETLDAGDLRKLKALTKAATQRNLSREDTDLIEITLSTLFAFDKLLHLLRDRSEQLDLLGSRLLWEEQRALAYSKRNEILAQIQSFLDNRVRWRPDIYNDILIPNTTGSSTGTAGSNRDSLSRSARFKLSEALSRDVVQLSSKISSLRHGPVLSSGKALDKLIEDGRKPVPDAMLDEQDRVEEKCEKELASLGKFLMTVNMQWQKADETYVETQKDVTALNALVSEIQTALTQFPSRKRAKSLNRRADAVAERLQSRSEQPLSSTIPQPKHPLFPGQASSNTELVNTLSGELTQARSILSEVQKTMNTYLAGCDAIDEAEKLRKEMVDCREEMSNLADRLQNGWEVEDGSGVPPNLSQTSCVEPARYSSFLTTFPSLSQRSSQLEELALKVAKRARLASLYLDKSGITLDFRQGYVREIDKLEDKVRAMVEALEEASANVNLLKEVRHIWSSMDDASKNIESVAPDLREALLRNHWKQQIGGDSAPPTPESPTAELPSRTVTPDLINSRIVSLKEHVEQNVNVPLSGMRDSIPSPLYNFICARRMSIERSIFDLQSMHRLLVDVLGQKYAMETIREEVHTLEGRIEDSKVEYDDHFDSMLQNIEVDAPTSTYSADQKEEEITAKEESLSRSVDSVHTDVNTFIDALPARVPLISRHSPTSTESAPSGGSRTTLAARFSFDPSAVDRSVRNDTNAYTMRLTSGVRSLQQKRSFSTFYRAARDASKQVILVRRSMRTLADQLEQHAKELEELSDAHLENADDALSAISGLKDSLEEIERSEAERLRTLVTAIRDDITRMQAVFDIQVDSVARSVLSARQQTFDEVNTHSNRILDMLSTLKTNVDKAEQMELAALAEMGRREKEAKEAEMRQQARRQKEQEEAERLFRERLRNDASFRVLDESTPKRDVRRNGLATEEDIFGRGSPSLSIDKETAELLSRVRALRKQLKSIGLNSVVRPPGAPRHRSLSASLPTPETAEAMASDFASLEVETNKLPTSAEDTTADTELRSLRLEMEASRELLRQVQRLALMQASVALCDATFSTFLDYIDSYPNAPPPDASREVGASRPSVLESPQERLSSKMAHAKGVFGDMNEHFAPVADDPRAMAEHSRLKQTWDELTEMAMEKISGLTSRATSSMSTYNSSGRNSSASSRSFNASESKRSRYANLSVNGKDGLLAPALSAQRRATSASSAGSGTARSSQQQAPRANLSNSRPPSNRSVSGPMKQAMPSVLSRPNSSLFNSTFASRQRTSSVSSNPPALSDVKPPTSRRRMSSGLSDASRAASPAPSVSSTRGSWSRGPRQSLNSIHRASTPKPRQPRTRYVANPKNKLDVALGDVINNLPVDINVEAVKDTWKDKSGKYWIGGNEPKLCFCRILRSQTVMVRVGGGWTELSKFIKDHFAELFRMLPETPPRPSSAGKERWISAATLRKAEGEDSLNKSAGSPESTTRNLPSFAVSTPDGTQKSASPGSSPLTAMQFIRRADANASEISLSSLALSGDMSTSGISTAASIRPRRRMSSTSSKFAWKP